METISNFAPLHDIEPRFKIVYTEQAIDFIASLPKKARQKIAFNIGKCMYVLDESLFKKLGDSGIWEFRTRYNGIAYRLFAFWDTDEETLVVATHGLVKKTQKTPAREIAKAEAIREKYFKDKHKK